MIWKMENYPEKYFLSMMVLFTQFHHSILRLQGGVHSSITTPHQDKKTREDVMAQQNKDVRGKER